LIFQGLCDITYFQIPMVSGKKIQVACAIIEKNGTFLVARRSDARPHGGFWEFPGGKIDPGEDAREAIIREIKEELGFTIAVKKPLASVTFEYPDKTVTLTPFICDIAEGSPKALEHDEILWVDKNEANGLRWLPPDAEILGNYLSQLRASRRSS
jgi:8-oxo-dGTP diphosphatase